MRFFRLPTEKIDGRLRLDRRFYTKNPGNDLELYIGGLTNRFAVFTGDVVADKAPADCTEAILQTLEKDMRREEKPAPAQPAATDKFTQLYKLGDISGYGSHSEADLALCIMLAKETKGDAAEMDRLFSASMRTTRCVATVSSSFITKVIGSPTCISLGSTGSTYITEPT